MPRRGDLTLLSASNLKSRDQIIRDSCTILVVMKVNTAEQSMVVWISQSPYGSILNQETSYQIMQLTNLTTYVAGTHDERFQIESRNKQSHID